MFALTALSAAGSERDQVTSLDAASYESGITTERRVNSESFITTT